MVRQSIWFFLMGWWYRMRRFSRLLSCTEIASFHSLGKACINLNHLSFIFCDERYFSFKNSQQWSFPSLSKSCATKLVPLFEKLEKMTHSFSIWMSLLSRRNGQAFDSGTEGGEIGIYCIYKLVLDSIS